MDTVHYSQTLYETIKKDITYLTLSFQKVEYIPISGWNGDNMITPSSNMSWYLGPTLLEAFDNIQEQKLPIDKPLRIPIRDVYKISGIVDEVPIGRVESGILKAGMNLQFAPANITTEVKSLEAHIEIYAATPGDNIGFHVKNVSVKDITRGMVAGDVTNNPPREVSDFIAQIVILNYQGEIEPGFTPILDCHTAHIPCKFVEIISKIDRRSGKELQQHPKFIRNGDCAIVKLVPTTPLCVETFADYPTLGRFLIKQTKQIIAVGIITQVNKIDSPNTMWRTS